MPSNKVIDSIDKIIEYIEKNIKEKITLDELATYSDFSKFYISRMFKATFNKNIMEYVRQRKLTQSIYDMQNTNFRLLDIAYEYGFSHYSTYIRSFKKTFGISPKKFFIEKVPINLVDKLDTKNLSPIGENAFAIKPVFMFKPEFSIVGIKHKIIFEENITSYTAAKAGFDFMENHKHKIKKALNSNIYIGYCEFFNNVTEYKYYMPSIQVPDIKNLPKGMVGLSIPLNHYAVFKFIFFQNIKTISINNFIEEDVYINQWLNSSNYEMKDYFMFESIDLNILRDDYCEVEIFIPVKKKTVYPGNSRILLPTQS